MLRGLSNELADSVELIIDCSQSKSKEGQCSTVIVTRPLVFGGPILDFKRGTGESECVVALMARATPMIALSYPLAPAPSFGSVS